MDKQVLPYDLLGGEQGVRSLCGAFYRIMDETAETQEIRAMHKESMAEIEEKLFEYLSGWLGGPRLYQERTGTVCINDPHKPFSIGEDQRDQWLLCMNKALEDIGANEEVRDMLKDPFYNIADFLRNK